jgi:hypothetical protein
MSSCYMCLSYMVSEIKADGASKVSWPSFNVGEPCVTSVSMMEPLPDMRMSQHPTRTIITVHQEGVKKHLRNLNPHKTTRRDDICSRLPKKKSHQNAPALTLLFQSCLD